MSGGFSELVKIYIENLNLPKEKKQKLLDSSPKTLADVSLWLEKNKDVKDVPKEPKSKFNPFSSKIKSDIAKEIQLFSGGNMGDSKISAQMFNDGGLVDTDDASWGLGLDKTQSSQGVQLYSCPAGQSKPQSKTIKYPQDTQKEQAVKDSQDNAIASIRESVNSAIETVMTQTEEQGCISKAYNSLKEYFDSEMAMSSVCRVIFAEKTTADLLQKAQDKELTKEEYWKTKISTAIDMLTAGRELSDEERTCLEERFASYTPEELNALIDKIKYTNNDDYTKITAQVDKLIEEGRNLLQSRRVDSSTVDLNDNPNSIRALMKNASAKELMTFEEVFKAERGVEFSAEAVKEYDEAMSQYAMAVTVSNKADRIHDTVSKAMNRLKGACSPDFTYEQRLEAEMKLELILLSELRMLYGDDEEKINEELKKISDGNMSYKNGKIECGAVQKTEYLLNASQKFLDEIEQRKNKMLGGKTVEDYKNDMASAYEHAYGRKNATQLARAFENDQEEVVGKVRTGVEYAGLGVMVAGMFICPPAAFAGAMVSSFGGIGVEALNESTRKDGLSKEAKEKIQKELMTNAALFVVGGAAGKMGSAAKAALIAEKCPALMACVADIGLDATLSLIGDLALTGEIDIEGEGLSQLMSILAGHYRAGKFGNAKEAVTGLFHKNTNYTPEQLAIKEHKQNLKIIKTKYKNDKRMLKFVKENINNKELIALLAKEEISANNLYALQNFNETQMANLKEVITAERKVPFSLDEAVSIANLVKGEDFQKLKERGLLNEIEGRTEKLNPNDLFELSKIPDEQWQTVQQRGLLKDVQGVSLDGFGISRLSEMSDTNYRRILDKKLIQLSMSFSHDGKFDYAGMAPFVEIPDELWPKVEQLLNKRDKLELTPYEYQKLSIMNDKDFARVKEFLDILDADTKLDSNALENITKMPGELYNKLKSSGRLKNIKPQEIEAFIAFGPYMGKNSIRDLSKTEKRQFMMDLMRNKAIFVQNEINVKDIIGLVPGNEAEYAQMMKKLSQSLNISTKPVTDADKAKIESDLYKLADVLKNADLSDLEEIELTMPQKEFISKAQELMKGLSDEEKAKVMEYFGFKIVDGKLVGYPNAMDKDLSLADISSQQTIDVVNKMKGLVDSYTDNNFITVKDHPELNEVLKEISRLVPEIFNQIDGSKMPVETIKALQKIVQKPGFDNLSDSDKKVMIAAALLHNTDKTSGSTSESAFDAYFIGEKMGFSKAELNKLYKIVEASDLIEKFMNTKKTNSVYERNSERERVFDYLAFSLKDSNNFELAQMLYSTKEADGLTRHLDKMLQKRIKEIKSNDFLLPQTSSAELEAHAQMRNINGYNVKVVNSSDIPNFYVYIHALLGATTGGSTVTNVANFDAFSLVGNDAVICASYVGKGKTGTIGNEKYGLIFDVDPNNQHVAYGSDIWSGCKNTKEMVEEYFKNEPNAYCSKEKQDQRRMVSEALKKIMKISDEEYIKRLEALKQKAGDEPLTFEKIKELDPEMGRAYEKLLNYDNEGVDALMRVTSHNEILVTNPKVKGIFTKDIKNLPEELLKYAQENNIPIVIIS